MSRARHSTVHAVLGCVFVFSLAWGTCMAHATVTQIWMCRCALFVAHAFRQPMHLCARRGAAQAAALGAGLFFFSEKMTDLVQSKSLPDGYTVRARAMLLSSSP